MSEDSAPKVWRMQSTKYGANMPSSGRIISWSLIYAGPKGYDDFTPYPIALIKLPDGSVILSQIVDYQDKDLKIGTQVEPVFRKVYVANKSGVIHYGIKFRPSNW
jgi:uncharacterized protein